VANAETSPSRDFGSTGEPDATGAAAQEPSTVGSLHPRVKLLHGGFP